MHLSMVYELISKPCTSWVSVSLPMFAKSHAWLSSWAAKPGVCFTNVSRALQDILLKFVYCRNRSSYENVKLKLCTCAQSIGHTYKVSVWNSHHKCEFQYCVFFARLFWRARETLVKQPPDNWPSQLTKDCQPSDCTEEHYVSLPGMEHMPVELRKIYGYSYIWHNTERWQIGWSILLFIFISELIFDSLFDV